MTKIPTKVEFDRSKIYEPLNYEPEPLNYKGKIPWIIQQQIGATNGIHYKDRVGKLNDYPIYNLPVPKVSNNLMLDIGNGWGRWLLAGANKGYIPIGIDIRLEFCKTALNTLYNNNRSGYSVVADLKNLPFQESIFDLVWSFSVIQHTHKERLLSCLQHINRILNQNGYTFLEFPNKNGIHNKMGNVQKEMKAADDINSWSVRYYTINEYKKIFNPIFNNFKYKNHSFLGIGILNEDLKYVSLKNKIIVALSLLGSMLTKLVPQLTEFSDSIYIQSKKNTETISNFNNNINLFLNAHNSNPKDNLNVRYLLQCPVTGGVLVLNEDRTKLVSTKGGFSFPIIDGIPIMIDTEKQSI